MGGDDAAQVDEAAGGRDDDEAGHGAGDEAQHGGAAFGQPLCEHPAERPRRGADLRAGGAAERRGRCQDVAGSGRMWQDVAGSGRMWQDVAGCGRIWQEVAGSGRMWQDLAGSGRIWQGPSVVRVERTRLGDGHGEPGVASGGHGGAGVAAKPAGRGGQWGRAGRTGADERHRAAATPISPPAATSRKREARKGKMLERRGVMTPEAAIAARRGGSRGMEGGTKMEGGRRLARGGWPGDVACRCHGPGGSSGSTRSARGSRRSARPGGAVPRSRAEAAPAHAFGR